MRSSTFASVSPGVNTTRAPKGTALDRTPTTYTVSGSVAIASNANSPRAFETTLRRPGTPSGFRL